MLGALALRESKSDELFTIEGEKEGGKDRHACIYIHIYIHKHTDIYLYTGRIYKYVYIHILGRNTT